jgi:flagellar assembly protein FliH
MENSRIPADRSQQFANWQLPDVGAENTVRAGRDPGDEIVARHLTARDLESITQQAHEEGFGQGRAEGHEAGYAVGLAEGRKAARAELAQQVGQLRAVMADLLEPIEGQAQAIEQALTQLAVDIAQAVLGREPALPPGQLLPVVRAAVRELPVCSRNITVVLHPQQLALIRECADWPSTWTLQSDPAVEPGGCRVVSEHSVVDYTVGLRFRQVAEKLLAEHAGADQPEPGLLMERFDD